MSEFLPLKPDDFDQLKVIGKGAFSKVFLVRHRATGLICAMKKINKQQVVESDCLDGMRTEREILGRAIDFPFIVDLYFAFETVTHWYLCMEFCAGGEVYTLITHEGRWLEYPQVQHYAAELVLGIEWLHHHKFMHRDLKCENIMISQEGHAKLIDFGVSAGAMPVLTPAYKQLRKIQLNMSGLHSQGDVSVNSIDYETVSDDEDEETICQEHKVCRCHQNFGMIKASSELRGSIEYMAPEMLTQEQYGPAIDFYSLGLVLFDMLSGGQHPFKIMGQKATPAEIFALIINAKDIKMPHYFSDVASDLIAKLMEQDPESRLGCGPTGCDDIRSHPFFKGIKWRDIEKRRVKPPIEPQMMGEDDVTQFDSLFTNERITDYSTHDEAESPHNKCQIADFLFINPNIFKYLPEAYFQTPPSWEFFEEK